mgnify:CR=1 FL=1
MGEYSKILTPSFNPSISRHLFGSDRYGRHLLATRDRQKPGFPDTDIQSVGAEGTSVIGDLAWVLRRRGQRPKLPWERFYAILKVYPLPPPRLVHDWRTPSKAALG